MAHPGNKPPASHDPISVAIPLLEPVPDLDQRLREWHAVLEKRRHSFEMLLVAPQDSEMASRAEALSRSHPEVRMLVGDPGLRIGAALRLALATATKPLFFYTTLEYPYLPADLQRLLDRIDDVDLVTAFRSAHPIPAPVRWLRTTGNLLLRILVGWKREIAPGWIGSSALAYARLLRTLMGVHVLDVDSAFKLFRREIFERIPIQSEGAFVHAELIAKANFLTCWMDEVPIGAARGAKVPPFSWADRLSDLRRVLSRPDFGAWPLNKESPPATEPVHLPTPS